MDPFRSNGKENTNKLFSEDLGFETAFGFSYKTTQSSTKKILIIHLGEDIVRWCPTEYRQFPDLPGPWFIREIL